MAISIGLGVSISPLKFRTGLGGNGPDLFFLALSGNTLTYSGRGLTLENNTLRFI